MSRPVRHMIDHSTAIDVVPASNMIVHVAELRSNTKGGLKNRDEVQYSLTESAVPRCGRCDRRHSRGEVREGALAHDRSEHGMVMRKVR